MKIGRQKADTLRNLLRLVGSDERKFLIDKTYERLEDMPDSDCEAIESALWSALEASMQ